MKNVSKAEMSKEIKDLEDSVRQRDALITAKDKENGQLRLQLESADRVGTKYASKIRDLEAAKWRLYDLEDEYRKEIKQLRDAATADAFAIRELRSEIKNLRLRGEVDDELHAKKSKEIHRLRQHIDDDEITILNKQNEINNLHCEVKLLKGKVADLEQKRNDSRRFHYATEALGNPLHFQRVSGD